VPATQCLHLGFQATTHQRPCSKSSKMAVARRAVVGLTPSSHSKSPFCRTRTPHFPVLNSILMEIGIPVGWEVFLVFRKLVPCFHRIVHCTRSGVPGTACSGSNGHPIHVLLDHPHSYSTTAVLESNGRQSAERLRKSNNSICCLQLLERVRSDSTAVVAARTLLAVYWSSPTHEYTVR